MLIGNGNGSFRMTPWPVVKSERNKSFRCEIFNIKREMCEVGTMAASRVSMRTIADQNGNEKLSAGVSGKYNDPSLLPKLHAP